MELELEAPGPRAAGALLFSAGGAGLGECALDPLLARLGSVGAGLLGKNGLSGWLVSSSGAVAPSVGGRGRYLLLLKLLGSRSDR
jgi:hypothetical protein